jgi:hypothetical protein
LKRGVFCLRLYTVLILLYGLYIQETYSIGVCYTPFPHPYISTTEKYRNDNRFGGMQFASVGKAPDP